MTEAFEFINWTKMFSKNYFWDSYWFTIIIAGTSTLLTMLIAFPASFTLAFKVSDNIRRWAIFMLIIPFFTSYLVRTFSWYVILVYLFFHSIFILLKLFYSSLFYLI